MVDDENEILGHQHGSSVERAADAFEQFNETTDGEDPRLGHGPAEVLVEAEDGTHRVTDGVGQQQTLGGCG